MDKKEKRRAIVMIAIVAALVVASTTTYFLLNPGHDSLLPNQISVNSNIEGGIPP
jgi:PDZ domain-containing secreted protein